MIRQAISCDICGRDKQQTNHWFVAYEHGSELRISGWNSQVRMSTKAKHLCGQTCLHKLVDDFMARTLALRAGAVSDEIASVDEARPAAMAARGDVSLTSASAHLPPAHIAPVLASCSDECESSARLIPAAAAVPSRQLPKLIAPQVAVRLRDEVESSARLVTVSEETTGLNRPAYNSRAWRSEAWRREQEREKRSTEHTGSSAPLDP